MANGEKMKIWYDACTGKHVRYAVAVAKRFRELGHEMILTTRRHPDTTALANILNEKFTVVGAYNPRSLYTRLKESARRMLQFCKMFEENPPDIAIAHQSVELCRVAFGLNIPIILTADTPHAYAVNKLTIPFSDTLITSEAIPKNFFKRYGAQKIIQFKGVDEVAWIKNFRPTKKYQFEKPLIIIRQMETRASYAIGKTDITEKLAKKLSSLGNVLFLPRFHGKRKKELKTPKEYIDSATLVAHADLVIGIGGTITREAALQGIPTIAISTLGYSYVNHYLAKKGFPLFIVKPSKVLTYAKKHIGKKLDVKEKLKELENPVDTVEKAVKEIKNK